jgi:hypothetical protein
MINRRCIPKAAILTVCSRARFLTTQGEFTSAHTIVLHDVCLPKFSFSWRFKTIKAFLFDAENCPYDLLLGRKFLKQAKMKYHCKRPYHISQHDVPVYKKEMLRQESIGVLERVWETVWGLPGFVRPKKDGTIRTIEDLRELNKCVVREVYPLPRIQDIMHRRRKYQYFTKIDISIQYYTFMLDDKSANYVIIVTPFGKWRRVRVPMGFLGSTDWAQATMEEIFQDVIQDVECYINDIGIFDTDWDSHIKMIDLVLARLEENGFTVNPLKCEWAVCETDWLGHFLTPDGPKPWAKNIELILALAPPSSLKELQSFIGFVNFYKDYWKRHDHIMTPLSALTGLKSNKLFRERWLKAQTPLLLPD